MRAQSTATPSYWALGNWKAQIPAAGARAFVARLGARLAQTPLPAGVMVGVAPPMALLGALTELETPPGFVWGAQDCCAEGPGAYTGEVAAETLYALGARWVLVGHAERRRRWNETDATTQAKAQAARAAGLEAIVCLDAEEGALAAQAQASGALAGRPAAWEPPWAIGSGAAAAPEAVARAMRALAPCAGLYGGSATAESAYALTSTGEAQGLLVGSASLDADAFADLVAQAARAWRARARGV